MQRIQDNNLFEYFSEIIDAVNVSIYWKDLNGYYLGCNTYAAQEVGLEKLDLIGKSDYDLFGQEIADKFRKNDLKVINENVEIVIEEYSKSLNGKRVVQLSSKKPLYNKNHEIIGIIGNSVDITPHKEKEHLELENQAHMVRAIEDEKFRNLIGQMIHDIQQPLASLLMTVNSTNDIPEEKRIILRNSTTAITDITNQLLRQYEPNSNKHDKNSHERQISLISIVLFDVVGDIRQRYKNIPIKFEYDINASNAFACIKANINNFKRAIFNIINNAVEAMPKSGGLIETRLTVNDEWVIITILDNGSGIPSKILEKIKGNETVTYGKKSGHGLGLSQVNDMVKANFGELSIASSTGKVGHGTTVILKFPKVVNPDLFIEQIELQKTDTIIILDDDKNIHGGWDSKLEYILNKIPTLKIKHFFDALDVIEFVNGLSIKDKRNILFLCDYELIGQKLSGLDVISQIKIKRSILVTSHYYNLEVRKKAVQNKVKILPKQLVHTVPIQISQPLKKEKLMNVHMIFVDDEKMFTNVLISKYYNNLITAQYSCPLAFLDEIGYYPKDTRIILDNYFYMPDGEAYNIDGIMLAKQLYQQGYTNLVLLTGERFCNVPDYLKLVLKMDHDGLSKLDKI